MNDEALDESKELSTPAEVHEEATKNQAGEAESRFKSMCKNFWKRISGRN